jgi:crossover junction endodeoxyribonuclease RuvC
MSPSGPLIIFGIDPGLTCTGYGVIAVESSSHRCLDFGAIKPPPGASHTEKLMRIHEGLYDAMRNVQPQEVAVEDFIIGHTRAAVAIGEARAAATLAAGRMGLPVSLYKPSEVKQFVTSYGRGSKEQVAAMVQALLGLREPPASPDAADALAVALCHALRRESVLTAEDQALSVTGPGRARR